jgi:hypothetical protein
MSDTPRTDEQINGEPCTRFEILAGDSLRNASVPSEFARGLEEELNVELERANYYRDKWQRSEQRIKRLEEAGNEMANAYEEICHDSYDKKQIANWRKSKEAKP